MSWSRTYRGAEPIRVNKWLAQEGVCSRREAEALIASGQLFIAQAPLKDMGHKINPGETLTLHDQAKAGLDAQITVVINKPVGFVSAQPELGQTPAARLLTPRNLWGPAPMAPDPAWRLAPLGRLDKDSRGLLLLSQDGVLTKAVIGPESKLDKEYLVAVSGQVTPAKLKRLRHGLSLDGRTLKPAHVEEIRPGLLRFVLHEGRNRQIRRMTQAVDLRVADLFRVRIGPLHLAGLPEGRWRQLTGEERASLIAGST